MYNAEQIYDKISKVSNNFEIAISENMCCNFFLLCDKVDFAQFDDLITSMFCDDDTATIHRAETERACFIFVSSEEISMF